MMEHVMTWIGPGLDVAAVALLAMVLWRLGRDPSAAWSERETRLQTIFDDLRALVAQSEGLARDLDDRLAGRETRLRALLMEAETLVGGTPAAAPAERPSRVEVRDAAGDRVGSTPSAPPMDPEVVAQRIESLANDGIAIEEIARRVGVAAAEVRLVIGLKAARVTRRRSAGTEGRAHV